MDFMLIITKSQILGFLFITIDLYLLIDLIRNWIIFKNLKVYLKNINLY